MTNNQSLKELYVGLGGAEQDVELETTSVGVLNKIAEMYGGESGETNAEAIDNIAAVAGDIGGGEWGNFLFNFSTRNESAQVGEQTPVLSLKYYYWDANQKRIVARTVVGRLQPTLWSLSIAYPKGIGSRVFVTLDPLEPVTFEFEDSNGAYVYKNDDQWLIVFNVDGQHTPLIQRLTIVVKDPEA